MMTTVTPIQQKIRNKIRTARQIAEMIKPGDWIRPGHCSSSPIEFEAAVADKIGEGGEAFRKKPVELWYIGHFPPGRIAQTDPDGKYSIQHNDFVFPWARRQKDKTGIPEFVQLEWSFHTSWQYARWAHPEKEKCGLDWSAVSCSPPNAHGFFNFAYGTCAAWQILQCAKNRVLEVREDYPNALGWCHNTINVDEVDYIIEGDCEKFPFIQVTEPSSDPITEKIAENIVELMEDGDCVQLGIGALPTAVCDAISRAGLKKLGVHTEMLQEGLMRLIESGSVDNSLKPIDTGKSTWSMAFHLNNKRYYDFVHNNPELIV
jgi:acyl-CoA hydrolase